MLKMIWLKSQSELLQHFVKHPFVFRRHISDVQKKIRNSYYFMHGDVLLSSSTLSQLADEAADKSGDHIAFISAHQEISKTFSEFRHEVNKLASGLVALGLRKGDKIAICSPNSYEWPLVQFAAAKAGLILLNINPAFQAEEIEYCLKKVQCKALISWDFMKTQDFYQMISKIVPELPASKTRKIQSSNIPSLETVIMITENPREGVLTFKEAMNAGDSESDRTLGIIEKSVQFDDPVNLQFTSGTTGRPKGALLSHHNMINNALVSGRRLGHNLWKPTVCCQVPLFHCFGCVLGTLGSVIFQNTCVFPSVGFNAEASLQTINQYKCTSVYGTPTMFVDLLNNFKLLKPNISCLKQVVLGGSASPETLIRELKETFNVPYISIAYGTTETSPAVAVSGINDFENTAKGILQPLEFVEMKVIDDKGHLLPINTEGEICSRGHVLFMGYWEDPEKTAEVVDKTNWYHTGDSGIMNEYGFIQIKGRKKDMVIRGGENIYPQEIENFLHKHPAILEVHVVGVPDDRMGEELCAWIAVKEGENLTAEEVKAFYKGKMSHFKIPRYIIFVDTFPKTASGKIQKFKMRNISIEKLNLR